MKRVERRIGGLRNACVLASVVAWAQPALGQGVPPVFTDGLNVVKGAVEGRSMVEAMFLVDPTPAAVESLAQGIERTGGRVLFSDTRIGYVHAVLTFGAYFALRRSSAITIAETDGAVDNDFSIDGYTPKPMQPSRGAASIQRPKFDLATLHSGSPELAVTFTGDPDFLSAHPTFDGRGTGVAIIEGVGIIDTPGLTVSRIIGVGGASDEAPAAGQTPTRLEVKDQIAAAEIVHISTDPRGYFTEFGRTFCAPTPGDYLFDYAPTDGWREAAFADKRIALIWRAHEHKAWVDTDGTGDFRRVRPTGDFNETGDVASFPNLDLAPAEPSDHAAFVDAKRSVKVAVLFDARTGEPSLYPGVSAHATMTGGYATGAAIGGAVISAAPKAKLIFVSENSSYIHRRSHALEGIILAERDPEVDVLSMSHEIDNLESSEQSLVPVALDRIIRTYGKPLLFGAGNAASLSEAGSGVAGAAEVIAVGGYANGATLKNLAGYTTNRADYIHEYSRGPSRLGAMTPDLLAPAFGIDIESCESAGYTPSRALPPCYHSAAGTSAATPMAAGAAAALISGAKQRHLPFGAERIAWAMKAGARFLSDWPAYAQGAGLLRMPESWTLLERSGALPAWRISPDIEVAAPLANRWTPYLTKTPIGTGLYEREGWTKGAVQERDITLTRHSGPTGPVIYTLDMQGNDGTYAVIGNRQVALPLSRPITIHIRVAPQTSGIHSATLRLLDREMQWPVKWISMIVVAAEQLKAKDGFTATMAPSREFLIPANTFFNVPVGTKVLRMDIASSGGTGTTPYVKPPLYITQMGQSNPNFARNWFLTNFDKHPDATRLYPAPPYGVWEVAITDVFSALFFKPEKVERNFSSVTLTALSARIDATATAAAPGKALVTASVRNDMGSLRDASVVAEIGSLEETKVGANVVGGTPFVSQFHVSPGALTLRVDVQALDGKTPLRLFLYDCSAAQKYDCKLWDMPLEATTGYTIRKPDAGAWRVVVLPYAADAAATPYTLLVMQTNDKYGHAQAQAAPAPKASGESWRVAFDVDIDPESVPINAKLAALIELRDLDSECAEQQSIEGGGDVTQRPVAIGQALVAIPDSAAGLGPRR